MTQGYNTLILIVALGAIYSITYWLQKKGKISLITHRKIWNIALTISFLFSALTGLVAAIIIDFSLITSWYRTLMWIHVETGIIMAISGIFHALWHIAYYKAILFNKK